MIDLSAPNRIAALIADGIKDTGECLAAYMRVYAEICSQCEFLDECISGYESPDADSSIAFGYSDEEIEEKKQLLTQLEAIKPIIHKIISEGMNHNIALTGAMATLSEVSASFEGLDASIKALKGE